MRSQSEREGSTNNQRYLGDKNRENRIFIEYIGEIGDQGRYLRDRTGSDSAGQDITLAPALTVSARYSVFPVRFGSKCFFMRTRDERSSRKNAERGNRRLSAARFRRIDILPAMVLLADETISITPKLAAIVLHCATADLWRFSTFRFSFKIVYFSTNSLFI